MASSDGVAQIVRGDLGRVEAAHQDALAGSDASLRDAMAPALKAFRLENKDLKLRKVNVDEVGNRHYRYDQTFNGLPVIGGDLVVHVDIKGTISSINGTARGDIAPTLGASAVARSAANASIENDSRWAGMTGRTIREARTVYIQTQAGTLHKAYEQIVEGQRGEDPVSDKVYVDVDTGLVLEHHPQIQHARNRNTYSANNGTSLPGTIKRTETQAPTADVDVNAAHDGAGHTYDLYATMWNRDGIDNAGMNMISTVHYSSNYCNAFWNNTQMAYGDGNASQNCGPLARSIDVAAHEMTHGVTSRESNLTYSGESGGLNESLSDIWGGGVEAWVDAGRTNPATFSLANDVFLIGDEVLPPFLRSMCDPVADSRSKDAWYSGIGGIDVHYSSGPNNLVFCLLSKGGTHPRGATTTVVPAIGMEKALRLFYKANVDLLTSSSNYAAMRNAMVTAAQQLGYDTATQDAVGCAYAAIKVGTAPQSCGGAPPPPPPPPPPPGDNLLQNPGFESGAVNWTATSGVIGASNARTGGWSAWLNGYGSTHTDTLSQTVTNTATTAATQLCFYLRITTSEIPFLVYDRLTVQLNGTTLGSFSNMNSGAYASYTQKCYSVNVAPGASATVKFTGTEDSSLQTSFFIDDTSLQ
jgi:vibriolysin